MRGTNGGGFNQREFFEFTLNLCNKVTQYGNDFLSQAKCKFEVFYKFN